MDFEEHVLDHQLAGVNGNIYAVGPGTPRTKVRKKKGASRFFHGIPGTTNRISEGNAGITVKNLRNAEIIFVRNLREKLRPLTLDEALNTIVTGIMLPCGLFAGTGG